MEMGLFQQQKMKLVMTQELRQAISLLQYSTLELTEFLEEQALENPLMELKEKEKPELPRQEMPVMWNDDPDESQGVDRDEDEQSSPFDRWIREDKQIADDLLEQIRFMSSPQVDLKLLQYLAYNVSDAGYLQGTYEEVKQQFSISEEDYEQAVHFLQSLEPAGVGARSLKECLLLQLQRKEQRHFLAEKLVEDYLEPLAEKKWKKISEDLSITLKEIQEVYDLIQTLDPRPGAHFGGEHVSVIMPDVYVDQSGQEFYIRLSDEGLPRIRLNRQYRHLLEEGVQSEASEYAERKYKQLMWILKSIDQRQQTLRAVSEAIVEKQKDFFVQGPSALKPMTLKDIAEKADVHESTVSRATTQKYMQTPVGLYELKYFFTSGLQSRSGEQTSASVIKSMIETMVENEDKKRPLSDQKIADQLKEEKEVSISRRAVAKYRGELNIPSSSKRKRYG